MSNMTQAWDYFPCNSGILFYNARPMKSLILITALAFLLPMQLQAAVVVELRPTIKKVAADHGLDPVLLEAIIRHESGHARSSAARRKNNIAGIMGRRGQRQYATKEECVEHLGRILANYKKRGRVTVDQIGPIYCQSSSPWEKHIKTMMRLIRAGRYDQAS